MERSVYFSEGKSSGKEAEERTLIRGCEGREEVYFSWKFLLRKKGERVFRPREGFRDSTEAASLGILSLGRGFYLSLRPSRRKAPRGGLVTQSTPRAETHLLLSRKRRRFVRGEKRLKGL